MEIAIAMAGFLGNALWLKERKKRYEAIWNTKG